MNNFENNIKKCDSLKQIFDLVNANYKTDEKMGILTGNIVKSKIPEIIKLLNLKKR